MKGLLPYQRAHAERVFRALRRLGIALDASDPGIGKTWVACWCAREGGWKLVVVAPKPTLPAWKKVAATFGIQIILITNYEALKTGKTGLGYFSSGRFVWNLPPGTLLVIDEAQRCKARNSQNAQLLIAAKCQRILTLLLSATAASNPLEMRAIGFALGLHNLTNYWAWARAHGVSKGRFGMEFQGGPTELSRVHRKIFDEIQAGARLRIKDIPNFPETTIVAEPIETGRTRQIQKIYDQMKKELNQALAQEDHGALDDLATRMEADRPCHLTILLRARQQIEFQKAESIVTLAKDGAEEGQSVAVFVNFDETLDLIAEKLGCDCVVRGGQTDEARADAIARFQSNQSPFIVANLKAGGVGISLHDPTGKRPRLAIISPTYSAQDLRQALGRVHRAGGAHSVQKIVFAAGTCEEEACAAVNRKLEHIDALNDGDLQPQQGEKP